MTISIRPTVARPAGATPSLTKGLFIAYLASIAAICGLLVIHGPQLRAAAEAEEARLAEQENREFCAKFGVGPETGRYAECVSGLAEIRASHLQRLNDSIL